MVRQTIKILLVGDEGTAGNRVAEILSSIEPDELPLDCSSLTIAATHQLDLKRYDLCLVDSNTEEALNFLNKSRKADCLIPIIAVSHNADEALQALRSGASDSLLIHELTPRTLIRSVSRVVDRAQKVGLQSENEQKYLALVENTSEIIYCHDFEGNYTFMNRAGEQLTGYSFEEAIKLNAAQVVAPEHRDLIEEMIRGKLEGREPSLYEIEIITKDGRRLPLEVSTHLIYSDGVPMGVQGAARDISLRRQREAVLVESEHRYRQLVNEANDIIYRIDLTGHFTFVNPIASDRGKN